MYLLFTAFVRHFFPLTHSIFRQVCAWCFTLLRQFVCVFFLFPTSVGKSEKVSLSLDTPALCVRMKYSLCGFTLPVLR